MYPSYFSFPTNQKHTPAHSPPSYHTLPFMSLLACLKIIMQNTIMDILQIPIQAT